MIRCFDTVIVGAGAAGLAAAYPPALAKVSCALLERGRQPGIKLLATGNGRCNYLNRNAGKNSYDSCSGDCRGFLSELFSVCPEKELEEQFKNMGIEPREEDEGRLYPRSNQAASIQQALIFAAQGSSVSLFTDFFARDIERTEGGFLVSSEDGRQVLGKKLILSGGGKAGIQYGSDGSVMKLALKLGHTGKKPVPALTRLVCAEDMEPLFGVRTRAKVSLIRIKNGIEEAAAADEGELQFSRDGISGICVFNISRNYIIEENTSYKALCDMFPEYGENELCSILEKRLSGFSRGGFSILFNGLLPDKLSSYLLEKTAKLKDKQRIEALSSLSKALPFTVIGAGGWKDAQVTAGGIDFHEVDPKTMESRIIPNLYLAGEMIDIDGPCGGYNLTFAFASGLAAGRNCAKKK